MIMEHYYPPVAAVAGQFRPEAGEIWEDEPPIPVDESDARLVEAFIRDRLPVHLRNAVRCRFIGRPRIIGTHQSIIDEWVSQAARMLQEAGRRFHVVE